MLFGITSAGEGLQKWLQDVLGDVDGCHVIANDLFIVGDNEADHDRIMRAVMKRATDNNVKFNPEKIQFRLPTVMHLGNIITD